MCVGMIEGGVPCWLWLLVMLLSMRERKGLSLSVSPLLGAPGPTGVHSCFGVGVAGEYRE